jgi:hypothetical protein
MNELSNNAERPPAYGEVVINNLGDGSVKILINSKLCKQCLIDIKPFELNQNCSIKVHTGKYIAEDCCCSTCYLLDCSYCIYLSSLVNKCKCPAEDNPRNESCFDCLMCCGCTICCIATACIPMFFCNAKKEHQHWSCCSDKQYKSTGCTIVQHQFI